MAAIENFTLGKSWGTSCSIAPVPPISSSQATVILVLSLILTLPTPHVIGRRHIIPEIERDATVYLVELLKSHGLELPQTFSSLPFRQQASYKEITYQDPFWNARRSQTGLLSINVQRQYFATAVNSRHFPPLLSIRTEFISQPPRTSVSK